MSAVLARGTVQLDARAAREKLRDYMLAEPALYVVELARAAVASDATAITVRNDSDDLELTFDGRPFSARTLVNVLDHVFDARSARERLLAIGINTALGLEPSFVDVYTSDADAPTVTRVRWTANSLVAEDGSLAGARVEVVKRPPGMPARGTRVHVHERLGSAVLAELFKSGAPVETLRLAEHATSRSVAISRGKSRIAPVAARGALLRQTVQASGVGTIEMSFPGTGRLDLAEHGFLLERRALPGLGGPLPLDVLVDAPALPTNASRSQVAFDEATERAISTHIETLATGVVREAAAALSGPHGQPLCEALAGLLYARSGARWAAPVTDPQSVSGRTELGEALLDVPFIALATGGHCSPRVLASGVSLQGALVWRKKTALEPTLARWLGPVVWLRDDSPHAALLVGVLGTSDAQRSISRAKRLATRWERWHAHPARVPAVARRTDDELVRVPFGDSVAARDADDAVLRNDSGSTEGIVGEVVVRAATAEAALTITAFVEGRPLGTTTRRGPSLCIDVAVGSPALRPNAELDAVADDDGLRRAVTAAARALLAALELVVGADKARPDDPRLRWLAPGLARATPETVRALARIGIDLVAGSFGGEPGGPGSASKRIDARPALAGFPIWPTTTGAWMSTAEVDELLIAPPHAVCFAADGSSDARGDGRVVLTVDARGAAVLRALMPLSSRLVDYSPYLGRPQPATISMPANETTAYPTLPLTRTKARALVAPSIAQGVLVLTHRGRVVSSAPRSGTLGNTSLVIDDGALVPDPVLAYRTLSAEGLSLEQSADFELAAALARVAHGEPKASEALRAYRGALPLHAVKFLLTAYAALRLLAADERLGDDAPSTVGELLRLIEWAPMLEVERTGQRPKLTTIGDITERAKAGPVAWITTAAPDIDLGDLEPLVLHDDSLAAALGQCLGIEVVAVQDTVDKLRRERERMGELERWARAQPSDERDPEEITGRPAVRVHVASNEAVAAVADTSDGAVTIRWRQRVVERRSLVLPVRVLVELGDASLLAPPEGVIPHGEPIVARVVVHAVRALVDAICERASKAQPPNEAELRFVTRWVAARPPKPARADAKRLEALAAAPLWRLAQGGVGAVTACLAGGRLCTSRAFFPQWRGPDDPNEPDVPPAIHLRIGDEVIERCVTRLASADANDVSDTLSRLQRIRVARASADVSQLRFPERPPSSALAGRIERIAPGIGFGELRLVPGDGPCTLELVIVDPDAGSSRASIAAPIALTAILQPLDAYPGLTVTERHHKIAAALVECAHRLVDDALAAGVDLPRWADRAVRWHLLTTVQSSPAGQRHPAFRDSAGEPMTAADLDTEVSLHESVAFSTWVPPGPLVPSEPLLRVVMLQTWEIELLRSRRTARDYSSELVDDSTAQTFHAATAATTIAVLDAVPSGSQRFALTPRAHGYDGELALLPWSGTADATVCWYHQRRPLGRSTVPSPWPAILAIDVPNLVPNRAYTAPTEDAVFRRAVSDVAELVHSFVAEKFSAPDDAIAWAHTWHPSSPARTGSRTVVLGVLWLPPDALAASHVDIHASGSPPAPWSPFVLEPGRKLPVPIAGSLYFHRDLETAAARESMALSIVSWAHEQLFRTLAADLESREASEAELTHAIRAILDDVGASLEKWAWRTKLPGSVTPIGMLASLSRVPGSILEVEPGDRRAHTESGVVTSCDSQWLALLRARGLTSLGPASRPVVPMLVAAPPSAEPDAPRGSLDPAAQVTRLVRSCGIGKDWLSAIVVRKGKGKRPVEIVAGPVAVLDTAHPAVAAWLVDDDPAAAARLTALIASESNRAGLEVTDDDEARVLVQLLEGLAAG